MRKDQRIEVRAKSFALHSPFARNFFVTWVSCEHGLWGLFTKWRRSGSAGHFCTRVHVGPDVWLVACGREKLTFGTLIFAPFAQIRLGWYLQTISVFEELEKFSHRKSSSKIFLFFRIDDSEQCMHRTRGRWKKIAPTATKKETLFLICGCWCNFFHRPLIGLRTTAQHCRAATRTAVVGGKRHLRLGFALFVFPTEKGPTPSVLAVLVLFLRLLAFVTVLCHLPSARSGRYMCTTVRVGCHT